MCVLFFLSHWSVSSDMMPLHSYILQRVLPKNVGNSLTVWLQFNIHIRKLRLTQYQLLIYSPYLTFTNCFNNFLCCKNNFYFWSRIQSRATVCILIFSVRVLQNLFHRSWHFLEILTGYFVKCSSVLVPLSSPPGRVLLSGVPQNWYCFFSVSWEASCQLVPFPVKLTLIIRMVSASFLYWKITDFLFVINK